MSSSDQPPSEDLPQPIEAASPTVDAPEAKSRGPKHAAAKKRRRFWPRNRWIQALLSLAIVLVLLVGAAAGYTYYQTTRIHRIEVKNLSKAATGKSKGTENILMVGSTDRCAQTVQNPIYGICSQGVNGVNSDVVMILHLDFNKSQMSILSIPRDTFIPNARASGANKIDAALAEGPSQLVNAIQQDFGIPIQHYVELNFQTFAEVVDALGGVSMYFPMPVYDAYSQLKQSTIGCVHMNGVEALAVVRARHLQYQSSASAGSNPAYWPQENLSDLARIRRDHEFLRVLGAAVVAQGLGNPLTDARIVSAVAPNLAVDSTFSTGDMINLVLQFHNVNPGTVPQYTLPVMTSTSFSYVYKGYNYGNVTFPINDPDLATITQFLGVSYDVNTMTGGTLPTPLQTTVSVLNGSGTYNEASATAAALKARGFNIGTVGDTSPVGNPAETTVSYNSLNPAVVAQAQTVLRAMTGQTILAYDPTQTSPVTVITGTNFAVSPPPVLVPATTTTKPKPGQTTTTAAPTTTTTTEISGFSAANSATSELQPWDPRSCTASGGEGK
jgi:LCP family protein required for cell wall assembly